MHSQKGLTKEFSVCKVVRLNTDAGVVNLDADDDSIQRRSSLVPSIVRNQRVVRQWRLHHVHLAVCAAVGAPVHIEAILCTVMVIQRSGASRPDGRTTTGGLKPVRVETPALDGSRKAVDAITAILLLRPLSISV